MNREGYWVRTLINGEVSSVVYATNDYKDRYWDIDNHVWVDLENPVMDLSDNDDWDKVPESEALSTLGLTAWE